ncbi:hypothetical protein [Streptomyces europaeiscabiei]|uniref:hypothetical protein n=1 Tax=Streptomyces europaeiscabiei TaxID=146819 RepID=UPI0038F73A69
MTWHQDGSWRRQMARAFDDLAADCSSNAEVEPRCTGEEMALHLGISRAQDLTRNRPRLVRDTVANLPEDRGDFDWGACSDVLFQDFSDHSRTTAARRAVLYLSRVRRHFTQVRRHDPLSGK